MEWRGVGVGCSRPLLHHSITDHSATSFTLPLPLHPLRVAPEAVEVVVAAGVLAEDVDDHVHAVEQDPVAGVVADARQARKPSGSPISSTASLALFIWRGLVPVARTKKSVTGETPETSSTTTL